jgi:hypothetical protein
VEILGIEVDVDDAGVEPASLAIVNIVFYMFSCLISSGNRIIRVIGVIRIPYLRGR